MATYAIVNMKRIEKHKLLLTARNSINNLSHCKDLLEIGQLPNTIANI
jgi:hypothetical protein